MEKYMKFIMVIVCFLLLAGTANAQQHLGWATVRYDARYYPDFFHGRGGPEGHSGAYIQIKVNINDYNDITNINVKAKHISGFEVSLRGDDPSCLVVSPWPHMSSYGVRLAPQDWWMTGEWEFTLQYTELGKKKVIEESKIVNVPSFNFPPEPTGIQIAHNLEGLGKTWLVWNSIGDPGTGDNKKLVIYQIAHYTASSPPCIDEWIGINEGSNNYKLLSGNRIAFDLSTTKNSWASGDLIRIENRVYDEIHPDGPYRHDRAARYFFLPQLPAPE